MRRTGRAASRPGDILVLVRKRDAFAGALARELKQSGSVPVAGTDRLVLPSHIAIQDLMALGRFALLPEDDLSLAALMQEPAVRHRRGRCSMRFAASAARPDGVEPPEGTGAGGSRRWAGMSSRSSTRWMNDGAARCRVHDFYAALLGREGGRKQLLCAVRPPRSATCSTNS